MKQYKDRKKAFLGAIIAGTIGLAGSIASSLAAKNSKEKEDKLALANEEMIAQQKANAQKITAGNTTAGSLTNAYSNAYANEKNFRDRFYKMGGRRKCALGTEDINNIIGTLANTIGSTAGNVINSNPGVNISAEVAKQFPELQYGEQALNYKPNKQINTASYINKDNNQPIIFTDFRNPRYKAGGRKRC